MKFVGWIITAILSVIITGLAFIYFSPDFDMYVVKSESMRPTLEMGDIVVTGPVNGILGHTLNPGTIVSYREENKVVTHRVISLNSNSILTKGDAVEDLDPHSVLTSQVAGIYLFKIPKLGYLSAFLHTKLGWFLFILIPTVLLLALIIKEIIKEIFSGKKSETGIP